MDGIMAGFGVLVSLFLVFFLGGEKPEHQNLLKWCLHGRKQSENNA